MRPDVEIKRDAEEHLLWDAAVDATDIAITVHDGVVALSGFVRSYAQKREAERDAKRIAGVLGVANDIAVRLPATEARPDARIARDAASALRGSMPYTSERLNVAVKDGWLTIEGIVEWEYARERGLRAVEQVCGLRGVTSHIGLRRPVMPGQIQGIVEKQLSAVEHIASESPARPEATSGGGLRSWADRHAALASVPLPPPMQP